MVIYATTLLLFTSCFLSLWLHVTTLLWFRMQAARFIQIPLLGVSMLSDWLTMSGGSLLECKKIDWALSRLAHGDKKTLGGHKSHCEQNGEIKPDLSSASSVDCCILRTLITSASKQTDQCCNAGSLATYVCSGVEVSNAVQPFQQTITPHDWNAFCIVLTVRKFECCKLPCLSYVCGER